MDNKQMDSAMKAGTITSTPEGILYLLEDTAQRAEMVAHGLQGKKGTAKREENARAFRNVAQWLRAYMSRETARNATDTLSGISRVSLDSAIENQRWQPPGHILRAMPSSTEDMAHAVKVRVNKALRDGDCAKALKAFDVMGQYPENAKAEKTLKAVRRKVDKACSRKGT